MKRFVAILIHILILLGLLEAVHCTLCILACRMPSLRWLPGYYADPLGATFMLMFVMIFLGVVGLLALTLKRWLRIPWATGLSAVLYAGPVGLVAWAGDTGFPLFMLMPVWLRSAVRASARPANYLFLVVALVLFATACVRWMQSWKRATNKSVDHIS